MKSGAGVIKTTCSHILKFRSRWIHDIWLESFKKTFSQDWTHEVKKIWMGEQLGKYNFSKRSDSSYRSVWDKFDMVFGWNYFKKGDLNNRKGFQGEDLGKIIFGKRSDCWSESFQETETWAKTFTNWYLSCILELKRRRRGKLLTFQSSSI